MKNKPRLPNQLLKELEVGDGCTNDGRSGQKVKHTSFTNRKQIRKQARDLKKRQKMENRRRSLASRRKKLANQNPKTNSNKRNTRNIESENKALGVNRGPDGPQPPSKKPVDSSAEDEDCGESRPDATRRYLPPALRQPKGTNSLQCEMELTERRVRGLINRISEENIQCLVNEMKELFSAGKRSLISQAIADEIMRTIAAGPRATDIFTGIAAAAVAALTTLAKSHELSSAVLSQCAEQLERSYEAEDSLGTLNIVGLLCHFYLAGLTTAMVLYGLLDQLVSRFEAKPRNAVNREIKQAHGTDAGSGGGHQEQQVGSDWKAGELQEDIPGCTEVAGRYQSIPDGSTRPHLGENKLQAEVRQAAYSLIDSSTTDVSLKGQWWLPDPSNEDPDRTRRLIDGEVGDDLLQLARQQRMNTDVRKAIFCAIMGSSDVVDCCDKLLRMPLKGEQDREVIRIVVHCCLQEAKWNPFYSELVASLCRTKKSHEVTLKFCLKDKLKEAEGMEVRELDHLAKLIDALLHREVLQLSFLKATIYFSCALAILKWQGVEFDATEKSVFFWRIFLVYFLKGFKSNNAIEAAFSKQRASDSQMRLNSRLLLFLKYNFEPWISKLGPTTGTWGSSEEISLVLDRYRTVQTVLSSQSAS